MPTPNEQLAGYYMIEARVSTVCGRGYPLPVRQVLTIDGPAGGDLPGA